jgi:hypothetical protein
MEKTMGAKWAVPAIGIASGLLLFVASAIGGQPVLGLGMLAVMVIYSLVVVGLSGRSETAGILAGRPADERLASFNIVATAVAGTVAIVVAIGGFLLSIARGESGMDFALVAAAAGIGYLVAIGWLRWRG